MTIIGKKTTLREFALKVGKILKDASIDAVLSGGAVVSIYTENKYQSFDLDFITYSSLKEVEKAFGGTEFYREGRFFKHPKTDFFIDFPAPPVSVGNTPVTEFNEIVSKDKYLKLLTPTHCVMDRLAAYYHWNDRQALAQALMVALENVIDFDQVKEWSMDEGMGDRFDYFHSEYKKNKVK
jgi:hypothetical protein